jgi:pyrimidine-specific ribonucleoside hydrolase
MVGPTVYEPEQNLAKLPIGQSNVRLHLQNSSMKKASRAFDSFLKLSLCFFSILCFQPGGGICGQEKTAHRRVPVIDVTDLYQPFQDPGDNFDLLTAYALPEVDLKAVILDTHESFRKATSDHPILHDSDHNGPRDAGFVSVIQLNYIFNRNIPVAAGPFLPMKSPEDEMLDAPGFQQQGVELILKVLRNSPEPVSILSFGSARSIAVAYNRDPALFHRKVAKIYLSAGSSSPGYLEWNIALDINAALRLLRSDLPIDIFPCATKDGPFAYESHNSYWKLPDLEFIHDLDPKVRRYLDYAFGRTCRCDFLRAMDEDPSPSPKIEAYSHPHNVWETAVWMEVSNRVLVRHRDGSYRIIPVAEVSQKDFVLANRMQPCLLTVPNDAMFNFTLTQGKSNFRIYYRADPQQNEEALRQALPELYRSFHP